MQPHECSRTFDIATLDIAQGVVPAYGRSHRRGLVVKPVIQWLENLDPGGHRRIKGLRLVTAFGIASIAGSLYASSHALPEGNALGLTAAGFALWASVSESRGTRRESASDLLLLTLAAMAGALATAALVPMVDDLVPSATELVLIIGAFLVGYLRRFGITGTGIGSQFFIGQLLAFNAGMTHADMDVILVAGAIAAVASIVPRVLSGPAEHPPMPLQAAEVERGRLSPELAMGLQAAVAATVVVALNAAIGLEESVWAITACGYVIAGSRTGTADRVRRRIAGTVVGVPLGLAMLPIAFDYPLVIWATAALAMVIYAMALPERYDIACAAFAYTLVVTLAATGEHSYGLLAARLWETILGGAAGLAAAMLVFPLRPLPASSPDQH